MDSPDFFLMSRYGTSELYMDKIAARPKAGLPLAASVAASILGFAFMRHFGGESRKQEIEARQMNERIRALQMAQSAGDVSNLMGASGGSYQQPHLAGLHPGAFRDFRLNQLEKGAAAVAVEVGVELAKDAGIGGTALAAIGKALGKTKEFGKKMVKGTPFIGRGSLKGQALTLGAIGLGGYGLYKGTQAATAFGRTPARSGQNPYASTAPARYVNQWGVPVR